MIDKVEVDFMKEFPSIWWKFWNSRYRKLPRYLKDTYDLNTELVFPATEYHQTVYVDKKDWTMFLLRHQC